MKKPDYSECLSEGEKMLLKGIFFLYKTYPIVLEVLNPVETLSDIKKQL